MWDTSNETLFTPLLIIGITILVLILLVGINIIVVLVSGDAVGHLLSIDTNQVVPVLLGVMGGVDSLRHNASIEAIYPASVAGKDALRVVHVILIQIG